MKNLKKNNSVRILKLVFWRHRRFQQRFQLLRFRISNRGHRSQIAMLSIDMTCSGVQPRISPTRQIIIRVFVSLGVTRSLELGMTVSTFRFTDTCPNAYTFGDRLASCSPSEFCFLAVTAERVEYEYSLCACAKHENATKRDVPCFIFGHCDKNADWPSDSE